MTTITWLGHSVFLIDIDGKHVLVDPFLTGNPVAAMKAEAVPADFIVITHGHFDHIHDAAAIAKRTGALVISNFEITEWLSKQGVKKVHAMNTGGAFNFPFGNLKLNHALHSSMLPDGSNGGNPCGFVIRLAGGRKIYNAGDTGLFLDMQLIGEEGLDLAILPIGDNYTMGPDDALRAVKLLKPKHVIPTHFNTFSLIAQDADNWADRVRKETGVPVTVLKPGEKFELA